MPAPLLGGAGQSAGACKAAAAGLACAGCGVPCGLLDATRATCHGDNGRRHVLHSRVKRRPPSLHTVGQMKTDSYRPLSRRQTWLIAVAAVATAATILLTMLSKPGGAQGARKLPAGPQTCAEGQLSGCVGGKVDVIVPAAPAPASATPSAPGVGRSR